MTRRRYIAPATEICLAALRRAPLTSLRHLGWRYLDRRTFSCHTVSRLIEAGLAVRVGDEVRAA